MKQKSDTQSDRLPDTASGRYLVHLVHMLRSLTCIWLSSSLRSLFLSSSSKSMMSNTDSTPCNNNKNSFAKDTRILLLICKWSTTIIVRSLYMKAIEQYFHVVLFNSLYKMVLTFKSSHETLVYDHSKLLSSILRVLSDGLNCQVFGCNSSMWLYIPCQHNVWWFLGWNEESVSDRNLCSTWPV